MKNKYLFLMMFMSLIIVSIGQLSAYTPHKQDTDLSFSITSNFADNCTATIINSPNGTILINQVASKLSQTFSFNISSGNFTQTGIYQINIECTDGTNIVTQYEEFEVTPNGESLDIQTAMIQIIILLFFIFLGLGFYFLSNSINIENWHNSIVNKYQNSNYVKLVLSSIGYNLMKNTFVIYYLIGIPILITLVDISYAYGLDNLVDILNAIFIIYLVGVIIIGIYFFGYVQEWFMNLLEQIKNEDWGV